MATNTYLISVDIEGITGVATTAFAEPDGRCYQAAQKYMASDVNAVVEGILLVDPDADVVVRDAHGPATNLDLAELHPRARLAQGWGTELNMVTPGGDTCQGVFLVGYHAGGHDRRAVLAHTFMGTVEYFHVNGVSLNEAGLAGLYAGHFGVPVCFIGGDDRAVREAEALFDTIIGVAVKESHGRDCTVSLSLEEAARRLTINASQATRLLRESAVPPLRLKAPFVAELQLYDQGYRKSVYQSLVSVLSFDDRFVFDGASRTIGFEATSQLAIWQIFHMLAFLMIGVSSD